MGYGICIEYRYSTFPLCHEKLFLKYPLNNFRKHFDMDNLLLNEKGQAIIQIQIDPQTEKGSRNCEHE